jgi:hypothetical protein
VSLAGRGQKLEGAMDWALFHKEGESSGLCIITDGLDKIQRKFSCNVSRAGWVNGCMSLTANNPDDGTMGLTGIRQKIWKFAPGKYNEIKFAVFHAKGAEDAAAMFKRISDDPELTALWHY